MDAPGYSGVLQPGRRVLADGFQAVLTGSPMLHVLSVILSALLIAVGGYVCVLNWRLVYARSRGKSQSSWIPLVGGGLIAIGLAIDPRTRAWWWLPLLIDWGCAPGLLHTALFFLNRARRGDDHNRV